MITGLLATFAFAALVIRLRRPVAHLIRNRDLHDRLQHRALQETLRIFSWLWYLPILMMILVSAINLIGVLPGKDRSQPAVMLMAHYDTVVGSPGAVSPSATM